MLRQSTGWSQIENHDVVGHFFCHRSWGWSPRGRLRSIQEQNLEATCSAREVPGCSQHPNTSPNTFGAKLVDKELQLVFFSTLQLWFTYNGLERPCNMRQCRNYDLGVPGWGVSYGKLGARFYSVITWSFHVWCMRLEGIPIKDRKVIPSSFAGDSLSLPVDHWLS